MDAEQQQSQTDRWTVGKLLKWIDEFLARGGVDESLLSAQILLGHVLDCSRIELYARFDQQPSEDQLAELREIVKQAASGKPIAYLVGHKEFFSINFKVSPAVLIPRTETETLVEWVIRRARQKDLAGRDLKILDLCTGSGCIAVALARFLPSVQCVVAVDVSADAMEVADQNCRGAKGAQKVSQRCTVAETARKYQRL